MPSVKKTYGEKAGGLEGAWLSWIDVRAKCVLDGLDASPETLWSTLELASIGSPQ